MSKLFTLDKCNSTLVVGKYTPTRLIGMWTRHCRPHYSIVALNKIIKLRMRVTLTRIGC